MAKGQIKGLTVDQIEQIAEKESKNWLFMQSLVFELCHRLRKQEKIINQKEAA